MPVPETPEEKKKKLVSRLLAWWGESKRNYPWRREGDPYGVLVAELMLQRTKAAQVAAVYPSFIKKFPTPSALAAARPDDVEEFFRRLGLIWRSKKMRELGGVLVTKFNSRIPDTREELLSLPGVGEYAADAVLAFAYGKNVAAVDANVCRVIGRLFGMGASGEARRNPKFYETAQRMVPMGMAKEFNWAIIDFAALVCTPRKPRCHACPLKSFCIYNKHKTRCRLINPGRHGRAFQDR